MLFYGGEQPERLERYKKFMNLNLVTSLTAGELEESKNADRRPVAGFRLTALWDETYGFLMDLIPQLIKESGDERVLQRTGR
jgi:hypothetical protein